MKIFKAVLTYPSLIDCFHSWHESAISLDQVIIKMRSLCRLHCLILNCLMVHVVHAGDVGDDEYIDDESIE